MVSLAWDGVMFVLVQSNEMESRWIERIFYFYLDDVITMISKHGNLQGIAMTAKHKFKKSHFLIRYYWLYKMIKLQAYEMDNVVTMTFLA